MKFPLFLAIATVSLSALAPVASAMTPAEVRACNRLLTSINPQKADLRARKEQRDILAARAERAGERWEDAETISAFGPDEAADAADARIQFDEAVDRFEDSETQVQALSARLNADVAAFNRKCTKK